LNEIDENNGILPASLAKVSIIGHYL